ncbi:4435_t:CDS:1 [Diversispora eburnea]|uniref:4435_t:CDS:1 n=1 Tax=Diversispora eburnea TaxID=1213867 RepID=A0A9N8ZSR2_9GLOM|nr:4435_t:CDS:1 [Diversispora eburnea]
MKLKILILGAGYGTRLQHDIKQEPCQKYIHLLGLPKALLPIGDKDALITHWLQIFKNSELNSKNSINSSVYVVTNSKFYNNFISWANENGIPTSNIVNDGTTCNENRLGAISDIQFGLQYFQLYDSDVLIIGGDTLFLSDFNFNKLMKQFKDNKDGCLLTTYVVPPNENISKYGILTLENLSNNQILVNNFIEKPKNPSQKTISRNACPCFYFLKREVLPLINEFLKESKEDKTKTIEDRDATGKFLAWVINENKFKFYASKVEGRIDVGGLESYLDAQKYFENQKFPKLDSLEKRYQTN